MTRSVKCPGARADAVATPLTETRGTGLTVAVIILRFAVGALFAMSGFVKMIDLYGFIFKIEEYTGVWGIDVPRSVTMLGAMSLCVIEFVGGCVLATGMLKRVATWMLTLMMLMMTALTAWIYIADPVSDCGCFGEFMTLSNGATFAKNIVLLAALLFLCRYNAKVRISLLHHSIQWLGIVIMTSYIIAVGLYGYNVEPMLDFRPFAVGRELKAADDDSAEAEETLLYIYSKDGVERTFGIDALPDSTWTYVDAVDAAGSELDRAEVSSLTVYDTDGDDVTSEVLDGEGRQLLLIIPEPDRADISFTFQLNELNQWAASHDIDMVALLASNRAGIEWWRDLSMAAYPCYTVEDTKLKELSRGIMSLVYVDNGRVVFKRNLSSITSDDVSAIVSDRIPIESIAPAGSEWLLRLTAGMVAVLALITLMQDAITGIARRLRRLDKRLSRHEEDSVNKDSDETDTPTDN